VCLRKAERLKRKANRLQGIQELQQGISVRLVQLHELLFGFSGLSIMP
jgi:hypothetical protein